MTIKTIDVLGAEAFKSVVSKIRKHCDCGSDPDGYFTYIEETDTPPSTTIEKKLSQYFLGDEDIEILKQFTTTPTWRDRKFWWRILETELFVECELTAPIMFWVTNEFSKLFINDPKQALDLSTYGQVVSATEWLKSLKVSGRAAFNYHELSRWWHNPKIYDASVSEILTPWIEQLPYADIFICGVNPYKGD